MRTLPWLALLLAVSHLRIEGYRWQMIPGYVAVMVAPVFNPIFFERSSRPRRFALSIILALILSSAILGVVYPVFELPTPSGPLKVGTIQYDLVDETRNEEFSKTLTGPREVLIQVWYPAVPSPGQTSEPYRTRAETSFRTAYLTLVRTHSFHDAPILEGHAPFPVVLFTPSWHGTRNQNIVQVEELVSHGFVVVGVDHPYGSGVIAFPDGRIIRPQEQANFDTSTTETFQKSLHTAVEQVQVRAADLVFVLNSLERLNQKDPQGILTGRLDLDRVGVFGYSLGGAVALQAGWLDHRFKAVENLDGMMFGESFEQGIDQPFFVITDLSPATPKVESHISPAQDRWNQLIEKEDRALSQILAEHGGFILRIPRVEHGNFTDGALLSPLRRIADTGKSDSRVVMKIVNDYTIDFFESFLNIDDKPFPNKTLLRDPEIDFRSFSRPEQKSLTAP
jgi:predicted dienelactone hydrolase